MLEIRDIHKTYAGQPLLEGISFAVSRGETACLLGPSGSGKTTLLRIVAGLEEPEAGRVLWTERTSPISRPTGARWGWSFRTTHSSPT